MTTKLIQFPPATVEQDAKIKLFVKHLAELTGQTIEVKSMTVTIIEVPNDQKALITMFNNIARNQATKKDNGSS